MMRNKPDATDPDFLMEAAHRIRFAVSVLHHIHDKGALCGEDLDPEGVGYAMMTDDLEPVADALIDAAREPAEQIRARQRMEAKR